ncbi:virulence factor [Propionispira arboris]|uniref:Virulence factor n=1 Tax=Propionispira arboris TaxID=84035 RepID=A0A1H6X5Q9_9FIRM|nr:Gfo/Idh/MocA family oxidoreductase [Propionispira arboris]SEJ20192.1 virulence factor [Propionispira arboris]
MKDRKIRIGIIGLGEIAQKVYLPYLVQQTNWLLMGAYSPTKIKRDTICQYYRIPSFAAMGDLIDQCDAVFVHSSTCTHFAVVAEALKKGKDVYVDKPLASSIEEAEQLVQLSIKTGRKLMVGFNRRFVPLYIRAREQANNTAWIRMEKHRISSLHDVNFAVTMLDDYIHLVDTVRWLREPNNKLTGHINLNDAQQLVSAQHAYQSNNGSTVFIGMHRKSGTNLEQLEFVNENSVIRVKNMDTMEIEKAGKVITTTSGSWESILKRRGFEAAILHFIAAVQGDTIPAIDGIEALKTQQLLQDMIDLKYLEF